jgi:hypothetical protein
MSAPDALFAALPGTAMPISDQEILFLPQGRDDRHVMTLDVHVAFHACAAFASLAEHARALAQQYPQVAQSDIERVLSNLQQRGLLQSDAAFRAELASGVASPNTGAISTICILSEGHPAALESLLHSATEAGKRELNLALMDVSENPEHRARKAELMAEYGRRTGQRVTLLEQKRERIASEFSAQQPLHAQGMELLIGKSAPPRARALNTLALALRGEKVLVLDDHQRLRTYGPAEFELHLAAPQSRICRVFSNAESTFTALPRGPQLWDLANASLGATVASMAAQASFAGRMIGEFQNYQQAHIARITLGVLGSADTTHSLWLYAIAADALAGLNTRERVTQCLAGDAVNLYYGFAGVAPSVGKAACALDLSGAQGFALGSGESADRSFAALGQFVSPQHLELCLPIHLERRAPQLPRERANREAMPLSFARFAADQVGSLQRACFAESPSARWRWLAGQFQDLAEASNSVREAFLWNYISGKRAELLGELQHYLVNAPDAPEAWRVELLGTIQSQAEVLMQSRGNHLDDFNRFEKASDTLSLELRATASAVLAWDTAMAP